MREWLNRAVSKTVVPVRVPWVRIPPSPPNDCGIANFELQTLNDERGAKFEIRNSQFEIPLGEVQERLNWQHWKCCVRETVPWVRIPPSPPVRFWILDFGLGIEETEE